MLPRCGNARGKRERRRPCRFRDWPFDASVDPRLTDGGRRGADANPEGDGDAFHDPGEG